MVKLHFTALVVAFFSPFVGIGARSSSGNKQSVWLAVVIGSGVITMIMDGHLSGRWIEIIRERDIGSLPGRSTNC